MHNGMAIKLITRMAGPEGNFPSGSILNIAQIKEKQLIAGGYAMTLDTPEVIEVDEIKVEEIKTVNPKPKKKKAVSK